MSSASETTSPSKPSSSRSIRSTAALSVAGTSSTAGTITCAVITARTPAATAAAKGGRSRWRRVAASMSSTGSPTCESVRVPPCPGKCLAQAATPADCRPSTKALACRDTRSVSLPKPRSPMTGLSGSEPTSTTGARTRSIPAARLWRPMACATRRVVPRSSNLPSAACPGQEEPVAASRRVTSPPSSSLATTTPGRSACRAAVSCATSCVTLWAKRQTPPMPRSTRRASQSGGALPTKLGISVASTSRANAGSVGATTVSP